MVAPMGMPSVRAKIVEDPTVMSGEPLERGTRVPAETSLAHLRADRSAREMFQDYPTLPIDGIRAVGRWAEETCVIAWRTAVPAPGR